MMKEKVIITNPGDFENKKKTIIKQGSKHLHVISDFDRTITYGTTKEGKRTETVISQLRSNPDYLGEEYSKEAYKLFDFYHPIEISNEIPFEEKKEKMHEWWKKHFELLIMAGLNRKTMERVVKEKPLKFREGSLDFIQLLHSKEIPLVFMSAAPGDMLIEYLKKDNLLRDNVFIVSNLYKFDKEGKAIKILEPIIHTFNKTEVSLKNYPIYNKIAERRNIILLGDEVGDIGMAEGLDYDNIIKIGFLNENEKERLELYKKTFDIVIVGDGDFSFVNDLVKEIIS